MLDDDARAAKLEELLAFYDDYGRGMDGMQLPYLTHCFRARVIKSRAEEPEAATPRAEAPAEPPTDDDSGTLLIDFR